MMTSVGDLSFRSATEEDVRWLLELRMETMAPHLEASGAKLTASDQRDRVTRDFSFVRIVRLDGSEVGMLKLDQSSNPWVLIQIQLDSSVQGQGVGTRLIRHLQHQARTQGIGIELSVLKVNPAKNLYDRLGFKVIKETVDSYEMRYDANQEE